MRLGTTAAAAAATAVVVVVVVVVVLSFYLLYVCVGGMGCGCRYMGGQMSGQSRPVMVKSRKAARQLNHGPTSAKASHAWPFPPWASRFCGAAFLLIPT